MDDKLKPYLRTVMNYFHCNEHMAEIIIKSSQENGELDRIKNMCTLAPSERSVF